MGIYEEILALENDSNLSLDNVSDSLTTLSIHIKGEGFNCSVPGEVARAIWILQEAVYRSAAEILHGEPNIAKLTNEERSSLELNFSIEQGSSVYKGSVRGVLNLILKAMDGMESVDKRWVLITAIVAIIGTPAALTYFMNKSATDAMLQQAQILTQPLKQSLDVASDAIAKSSKTADSVTVGDRRYTKTDIENLNKKSQRQGPVFYTIEMKCKIVGIKKEADKGYKVELKNTENDKTFSARIESDDFFSGSENKAVQAKDIAPLIDSEEIVSISLLSKETKSLIEYVILDFEREQK